ncbi:MAG: hypothetical protein ACI4XI_05980 [Ruminococcus sp.]
MTPQEAIERLRKIPVRPKPDNALDMQAIIMAVKAVEKQIPKKTKGITDPMFGDTTIVCSSCGNANLANPFDISRVYDYCPNCGQALDWSEN